VQEHSLSKQNVLTSFVGKQCAASKQCGCKIVICPSKFGMIPRYEVLKLMNYMNHEINQQINPEKNQ